MTNGYVQQSTGLFQPDVAVHAARLKTRLRWCVQRAADTGRPALLRLHLRLPEVDPWHLCGASRVADVPAWPFFVWNDGQTDFCIAAWGPLKERHFTTSERFVEARAFCAELLEDTVDVRWDGTDALDHDVPLAFTGFAFSGQPSAPPWKTWQGGMMYVPQCLVYRRGITCGAVLGIEVAEAADVDALFDTLQRAILSLSKAIAESSTVAPVSVDSSHASTLKPVLVEEAEAWEQRVRRAQQAAADGCLQKVVLARAADFEAPGEQEFDADATLYTLRSKHPDSICFGIGHRDGSVFLGASPETLVHVSGRNLTTQAVAGTVPRGQTPEEDARLGAALLQSTKDRREHAVVVDVLRQALTPLCVELQSTAAPRLIRLPQMQHLETPFVGTLRQAGGVLEWVERLHPTPSVGGWPVRPALAWLREFEPLDRGWYAGPIGWLTAAGDGAFAVAIRSVLLHGKQARAYAGAGVVTASDPAAEWRETELKLRTVSEALKLRPLR